MIISGMLQIGCWTKNTNKNNKKKPSHNTPCRLVYVCLCVYLFGDAKSAEAVCSIQVQVVLSPANNLLLPFSFGVP